jgi:hypothetical protein
LLLLVEGACCDGSARVLKQQAAVVQVVDGQ